MNVGKRLKAFVATVTLVPALVVVPVAAVANDHAAAQATTNATQTLTTTATQTTTTLQDRLQKRKDALATKLTTAQTTMLKARCQAAQTKLTAVRDQAQTGVANRITVYRNIVTNLTTLMTKLDGVTDTSALKTAVDGLSAKIDDFDNSVATYKETLADILAMDCASDPTAFRASLDTAKSQQAQLVTDANAIRTYIQETVKPALQTIRTTLAASESKDQ